jgi:serine phosphatase RsbU (regulator of sigma subunit)
MEIQDPFQPSAGDAHDDVLRYAYRLDTLFDISRSLFTTFDAKAILKTCLLSTLGNFGVINGFIIVFKLPSREVIYFASQGFQESEIGELQLAAASGIDDFDFEKSHVIACQGRDLPPPLAAIECILPFGIDRSQIGWMGVGPKIMGGPYSEDEKKLLVTLKNSLVVALQNARSFEEIKRLNTDLIEKKTQLESTVKELEAAMIQVSEYSQHLEKIIAALNVAQEVQQSLLPRDPPQHKRLDLAGISLYCDETGGDYYDFIELPWLSPEACALVVGDVSGHGISSALLMAGVRAYLRGRAKQPGSAAEIITDLNRLVCADTEKTYQFMTLFFLMVDAATKRLTWVNAGHDPVFVYDPLMDHFEELRSKGLALGVDADWQYTEQSATAKPGQIVAMTTDGVIETHNQKNELFGRERFKETMRRNAGQGSEGILKAFVDSVEKFRGETSQHDDITLVVLKFRGDARQ